MKFTIKLEEYARFDKQNPTKLELDFESYAHCLNYILIDLLFILDEGEFDLNKQNAVKELEELLESNNGDGSDFIFWIKDTETKKKLWVSEEL